MGNIWQSLIKCFLYIFYRKINQNFHSNPLRNTGIGGGKVVSTTLLKLPKNWVIYIGDNVY